MQSGCDPHRSHCRINEPRAEVQLPAVCLRVVLLVAKSQRIHVVRCWEGAWVRWYGGRDGDFGDVQAAQIPS